MLFGILKRLEQIWLGSVGTRDKDELLGICNDKDRSHLHDIARERYVMAVKHIAELLSVVVNDCGSNRKMGVYMTDRIIDCIEGRLLHITFGCTGRKAEMRKADILADLFFWNFDSREMRVKIQTVARRNLDDGCFDHFNARIARTSMKLGVDLRPRNHNPSLN